MRPHSGGAIKIGYTKDLAIRKDQLEGIYNVRLVVLSTMEGSKKTEAEVHRRFAAYRLGRTEQFRPGPELTDHLFLSRVERWEAVTETIANEGSASINVVLRCSEEYKEWLDGLVSACGVMNAAQVVDEALKCLAMAREFKEPPLRYKPQVDRRRGEAWVRANRLSFKAEQPDTNP